MHEITKVALDAMGGDNAPVEIVKGAVNAVTSRTDIKVFLVGQEDVVREELAKYSYPADQIEVVHAPEVIEMAEPPVIAIRRKKESSLVVAMKMVKEGQADALVSAGSSGAILVGGARPYCSLLSDSIAVATYFALLSPQDAAMPATANTEVAAKTVATILLSFIIFILLFRFCLNL